MNNLLIFISGLLVSALILWFFKDMCNLSYLFIGFVSGVLSLGVTMFISGLKE